MILLSVLNKQPITISKLLHSLVSILEVDEFTGLLLSPHHSAWHMTSHRGIAQFAQRDGVSEHWDSPSGNVNHPMHHNVMKTAVKHR